MPAKGSLSAGGVSVCIRGEEGFELVVEHEARVPRLGVPGRAGDAIQYLGRKSRLVSIRRGSIYKQDNLAAEVAEAQQLRAWHDAGTKVDFFSKSETAGFRARIIHLRIVETPAQGFTYDLTAVETDPTPAGAAPACS